MPHDPASAVAQIHEYYRKRASTEAYATSPDFNLREVEINFLARWLRNDIAVLDAGCGNGYSTLCHAARFRASFTGIDFVLEMVEAARQLQQRFTLAGSVDFRRGDVTALEFPEASFDVVATQRCLLNLPSREAQWRAMAEVARVLRPGGIYLMLEGTLQGLRRLNAVRGKFALAPIPEAESTYNWFSNKFDEDEMLPVARSLFAKVEHIQRFGMYYFVSRVIHPLLVAPDQPKYDAPINAVARRICEEYPDFNEMGHVALFVLRR